MKTNHRAIVILVLIYCAFGMAQAKNWTWYIRSTTLSAGTPAHFDVVLGLKANLAADVGRLGNFNMRGTKSVSLYDFGAGNDPIIQGIAVPGILNTDMTVTNPAGADNWQLNYVYPGAAASGASVTAAGIEVCTLRFFVLNSTGTSTISLGTIQQTFESDNTTQATVSYDNSGGDVSLPIQLASFSAAISGNGVRLNWATMSETQNYGFEVQRSTSQTSGFASLPGSFVAGYGTTVERHEYSYLDLSAGVAKHFYRLKQIDLDGHFAVSEAIEPTGTTSVKESAPVAFALCQNYPNPFNPETTIKFSVVKNGPAKLTIYNIVGQEVAILFDGFAEVGQYYRVRFGAANLASGIYIYKLQSGEKSDVKKLLLLK